MINKELLKEIEEYCKINDLIVRDIVNIAIIRGFDIEKFGLTPTSAKKEIKPVEVIKVIEKVVKVSDDEKVNELLVEIDIIKKHNLEFHEKLNLWNKERQELKKELKECNDNTKKDIYGE